MAFQLHHNLAWPLEQAAHCDHQAAGGVGVRACVASPAFGCSGWAENRMAKGDRGLSTTQAATRNPVPDESNQTGGYGRVNKPAARNSKSAGGPLIEHLGRPYHFFDSFFGRAARYGPVSLALSSIVKKTRFTSCSLQAESMSIKLCTQVEHKYIRL